MNTFFNFNTANEQKFSKSHPAQTTTKDKPSSYNIFVITSMMTAITACSEYETKWGFSTRQIVQYFNI